MWEHVKVVTGCSGKGEKEGEQPLFKINWAGTSADNREGKVYSGQKKARLPYVIQLIYQDTKKLKGQ